MKSYNYNSIDDMVKLAYINEEGASKLYNYLQNVVLIGTSTGKVAGAIIDAFTNVGKGLAGGVANKVQQGWNAAKNIKQNYSDPNVPTTTQQYNKVDKQGFIDLLKQFNRYYTSDEISFIYNFVKQNGGVVSKIDKNTFSRVIAQNFPVNTEGKDKVKSLFSKKNLDEMLASKSPAYKTLMEMIALPFTDALDVGLLKLIEQTFPDYGEDFSIAEVRLGFLEAQQELKNPVQSKEQAVPGSGQEQVKDNTTNQGLVDTQTPQQEVPVQNQSKTLAQIILDETFDKNDEVYLQNKEQYNTLVTRYLKDNNTSLQRINAIIDEIVPDELEMVKGYLQGLNTPMNAEDFNNFEKSKQFHADIEKKIMKLSKVFQKTMDEVYKEIKTNSKSIQNKYNNPTYKKSIKTIQEGLEYIVYLKIKEFLGVNNGQTS